MERRRITHKWKIAFWTCFVLLLFTAGFGFYAILDQGVSLTYLRDDYSRTEAEMESLAELLNDSKLLKQQVLQILEDPDLPGFNSDTIYMEKFRLIFENDTLVKAEKIFKNSFPIE